MTRGRVWLRRVGLSAVRAQLISAHPIVAIDPIAAKRALALHYRAITHSIHLAGDVVEQIRALLPDGVDYTFEATGKPEVAAQAFAASATGGTTVLIGQPGPGRQGRFPVYDLTQFEHTILGTHIGGANPPSIYRDWPASSPPRNLIWLHWSPIASGWRRSTRLSPLSPRARPVASWSISYE